MCARSFTGFPRKGNQRYECEKEPQVGDAEHVKRRPDGELEPLL